ncbi:MAG TPA: hypothetical protein VFS39_07630 [Nitrospira sp.]|nr:hypothetical protein [Nitrospira sp.]
MDKVGIHAWIGGMVIVGMLSIAGCGGSGQTVLLDVIPKQAPAQMAEPEAVKVVIEPFEDRRVEKNRVGMRTHLWGGVTYFNVAGEKPGDVYAQALADRLRARGWHDRSWDVRVVPAGSASGADIVITGQILDLSANAKSRIFSTALSTSSKVTISARNNSDRSVTNRSIEGARTDTVFWFNEDDIQNLLKETIKDTIDRYVEDTTIVQRAVRPTK